MILPETTDQGALSVAEKMLSTVASLAIPHEQSGVSDHVTLSIGVATLCADENGKPEDLVEAADQMLYRAKERGRNCIEVALPKSALKNVGS